jgi:hypothetical protein
VVHVSWVNFKLQFFVDHVLLYFLAILRHMVDVIKSLPVALHHFVHNLVIPPLRHCLKLLIDWNLRQLFSSARSHRVRRLFGVRVVFATGVYCCGRMSSSRLFWILDHLSQTSSNYHWRMCELQWLLAVAWKWGISYALRKCLLVEMTLSSWFSQHFVLNSDMIYLWLIISHDFCLWLLYWEDKII